MKACVLCLLAALVAGSAALALAADQPAGAAAQSSMAMPTPGPEAKALEPFFGRTVIWTGTAPAGSMGPDSKETATHGRAICHPMYGGFSYGIDVEDAFGSGNSEFTWKGHMVVGYDSGTKTYKGLSADNTGELVTWNGTLDGDKLVLESAAPILMMGQMLNDRLTWVRQSDGSLAFTDEHQAQGGGDWTLAEKATMHTGGGMKGAAAAETKHGTKGGMKSGMKGGVKG